MEIAQDSAKPADTDASTWAVHLAHLHPEDEPRALDMWSFWGGEHQRKCKHLAAAAVAAFLSTKDA